LKFFPGLFQIFHLVRGHIFADSQIIEGFRGKMAQGKFLQHLLEVGGRLGIVFFADKIVPSREEEHGRELRRGQPAFEVVKYGPFIIQKIEIGGPDGPVFQDQIPSPLDINLNRNKILIEQRGYIQIRVRHGTQFGASPSAVLKKIQEDWLSFLAGTLQPFLKGFLPFDLGFQLFHFSSSLFLAISFYYP
jgi:hypothetical protein